MNTCVVFRLTGLCRAIVLGVFVCVSIGCGGPPEANARLTAARVAYDAAASDGDVSAFAGSALAQAREALERAWRERRDAEAVAHHAYVARQHVRLAEERVALALVERAIRKARLERQRALLTLRTAKAKAAMEAARPPVDAPAEVEAPSSEPAPEVAGPPRSVLGAVLTRRGLVLTLSEDAFAEDGVALRAEASPTIEALVDFLNEYPERRVQVEGFADASGSRAEARAVSRRRAEAVQAVLVERGVAPSRVAAVGLGAAYPVASNEEAEGRRQNRRVEIVISDPRGTIPDRD